MQSSDTKVVVNRRAESRTEWCSEHNQYAHTCLECKAFRMGIWIAVEYLVLTADQPSIADEIIATVGLTREHAIEIMKETQYGVAKIKRTLAIFGGIR